MTETKISANLPSLDVEMIHRAHPEERAESLTIRLTARPDFDAVGNMLAPFALPRLTGMPMHPMALWMQWAEAAWKPWLQLAGTTNPLLRPPQKR